MLSPNAKNRLWKSLSGPPPIGEAMDVFVVLDGATVRLLPDALEDDDAEFAPLLPLAGSDPVEATRAAYVMRLSADSPMLERLAFEGWKRNWGLYVLCQPGTDLDDLVSHLRELAQVRLPDGRIVFFRFYDPRVWLPFAPTCDAPQLDSLFGRVVSWYGCESDDGGALVLDGVKDGRPVRTSVMLDEFASQEPLPGVTQQS